MKKVLIIGASGLLGRHLLAHWPEDLELHVAGRSMSKLPEGTYLYKLDFGSDSHLGDLPDRIDAIIYLAQSDRYREFPEGAADMFAVNIAAPMRLLEYARRAGASQFIFASSGGVYGGSPAPVDEGMAISARGDLGFYLTTKLVTEMLAHNYAQLLDIVLLRLFFVYGEGQKRQMLVPRLIDNIRAGNPVLLQGDNGIRINPVNANDAARAVRAALGIEGSHTINVAGPEALSIREMCDAIGKEVSREPRYSVAEPASGDLIGDIERMRSLLVAPSLRFAQCLPMLVREGAR